MTLPISLTLPHRSQRNNFSTDTNPKKRERSTEPALIFQRSEIIKCPRFLAVDQPLLHILGLVILQNAFSVSISIRHTPTHTCSSSSNDLPVSLSLRPPIPPLPVLPDSQNYGRCSQRLWRILACCLSSASCRPHSVGMYFPPLYCFSSSCILNDRAGILPLTLHLRILGNAPRAQ